MIIVSKKAGCRSGITYFSGGYAYAASYGITSAGVTLQDIFDLLTSCCAAMTTNNTLSAGKLDSLLGDSKIIKRIYSDQRNQSQLIRDLEKEVRKVIERKK